MSSDAADDPVVQAVAAGDESAFAQVVERHRRELHVHCYRMLGSFEEAEDRVQETFLRAWLKRASFEGRSTFRAWLYRIATNACLEVIRRHPRAVPVPSGSGRWRPPYSELPWLQPYPDALLDAPASLDEGPDAVVVTRETIALAFLASIQLLPPKQRAVLILRDVVRFSAAETASVLEESVPAVNSALQRARATLKRYRPAEATTPASPPTDEERALVERYMKAHEQADPAAVIALLREDARLTISPTRLSWDGRDAITPDFMEGMNALGEFRSVAVGANCQPAVAHYLRRWGDTEFRAFTLVVLEIRDGALLEMTAFARPELFAAFGLPPIR